MCSKMYSLTVPVYLRDYFSGCYRANTSVRPYGICVFIYYVLLCAHFVRSVLLSYFILGEHIGSPLRVVVLFIMFFCAHLCVRPVLMSY